MKKCVLAVFLLLGGVSAGPAVSAAAIEGVIDSASAEIRNIWTEGGNDVYAPLHTHHLRSAYDDKKISSFNENPWGIGFGKGFKDARGSWHGLYAMEFQDSHNRIEPIGGYARLYPVAHFAGVSAHLGYTAFLTGRQDIGHYTPIPGVLPLASIEAGRVSLMTTFMPGGHNNGNIFFIFGKYSLAR